MDPNWALHLEYHHTGLNTMEGLLAALPNFLLLCHPISIGSCWFVDSWILQIKYFYNLKQASRDQQEMSVHLNAMLFQIAISWHAPNAPNQLCLQTSVSQWWSVFPTFWAYWFSYFQYCNSAEQRLTACARKPLSPTTNAMMICKLFHNPNQIHTTLSESRISFWFDRWFNDIQTVTDSPSFLLIQGILQHAFYGYDWSIIAIESIKCSPLFLCCFKSSST